MPHPNGNRREPILNLDRLRAGILAPMGPGRERNAHDPSLPSAVSRRSFLALGSASALFGRTEYAQRIELGPGVTFAPVPAGCILQAACRPVMDNRPAGVRTGLFSCVERDG